MRQSESVKTWVVYGMVVQGQPTLMNAVCEQSEWEAMERARPGVHSLIRSGIATESEAEKLARGTRGDPARKRGGGVRNEQAIDSSSGEGTTTPG